MNIRTSNFFNNYSDKFNAIYGNNNNFINNFVNKNFRKSMRLRFEYVFRDFNDFKNSTVLDVGCGAGHYCLKAYEKGASTVIGIDFASNMIEISKQKFENHNIKENYEFILANFLTYNFSSKFDYIIFMGFMDYIENANEIVSKAIKLTNKKSFFSFPKEGGFLALQRKIRYSYKCKLFYYNKDKIKKIFDKYNIKYEIENIDRDYFVTIKK